MYWSVKFILLLLLYWHKKQDSNVSDILSASFTEKIKKLRNVSQWNRFTTQFSSNRKDTEQNSFLFFYPAVIWFQRAFHKWIMQGLELLSVFKIKSAQQKRPKHHTHYIFQEQLLLCKLYLSDITFSVQHPAVLFWDVRVFFTHVFFNPSAFMDTDCKLDLRPAADRRRTV